MPGGFHRSTSKRTSLHQDERPKVVIVCEGAKTETGYFNALRMDLRLSKQLVPVHHSGATNPRNIVEFALAERKKQFQLHDWDERVRGDSIWAVYDGVEHYNHNKRDWDEALDLAKSNNVRLAISNPSFELWYLLHFQDQTKWLERDATYIQLKEKYIKNYKKAIFSILIGSKNERQLRLNGRIIWRRLPVNITNHYTNVFARKALLLL